MASSYGNQIELDRICTSLQNRIHHLFNLYNHQITELSSNIHELEQDMMKDVLLTFEKIKRKGKYSGLNQSEFTLVLKHLLADLSNKLSVPASIFIDGIYTSAHLYDEIYFLIENHFKYLYLKYELIEIDFLLKERNRILILQIAAISEPLPRISVSEKEISIKDCIYKKVDSLSASFTEEECFDYKVNYQIPLL